MKLRTILNFMLLLLLFLINDAVFQSRNHIDAYLEGFKTSEYPLIEQHEAVIILEDSNPQSIINTLSKKYYIDSVMVLQKTDLINILTEQYRLSESQDLLNDLSLPEVLKCSFRGNKFRELESGLFINFIQNSENVSRLLYSEDNYLKSWNIINLIEKIENVLNEYWLYLYYGFGILILLIVLDLSLIREKQNLDYWSVFLRAGGSPKHRFSKRIVSAVLFVLIPAVIALALEYFLFLHNQEIRQPDFNYHIIRSSGSIIFSILALMFIRNSKYD